jgi:lipopolysaccharide biosynthesis protein
MKIRRPSLWKLRRELDVARQQLWGLAGNLYEPWVQRHHDRHFVQRVKVVDGSQPLANKIALFLIFQPNGIPESVVLTCAHLQKNGYATLVVSNGYLSPGDRERLLPHVWRCAERPNYGYDFGGYRDGIRLLNGWSISPEMLIILNDSIWYPLYENDELIQRMEAEHANLVGTKNFINRNHHGVTAEGFLGSYFYLIKREAFVSEPFQQYWRRFRLTNNKYKVLRDGENAFTPLMVRSGLTMSALNRRRDFLDRIGAQTAPFLRETLCYAAYIDPDFANAGEMLLANYRDSIEWRQRAIEHIRRVATRRHYDASFCYAHFHLMRSHYVKKNNNDLFKRSRAAFLRAVDDGALPIPHACVIAEIRERVAK